MPSQLLSSLLFCRVVIQGIPLESWVSFTGKLGSGKLWKIMSKAQGQRKRNNSHRKGIQYHQCCYELSCLIGYKWSHSWVCCFISWRSENLLNFFGVPRKCYQSPHIWRRIYVSLANLQLWCWGVCLSHPRIRDDVLVSGKA